MSFDRVGFLGCCSWTVEALDTLGKVTGLMSEYALDFGELGPSASILACARSLKMLGTGPPSGSTLGLGLQLALNESRASQRQPQHDTVSSLHS